MTVAVRIAEAADAEAVTAVFLASRAAALPWLPDLHTDAETRRFVEHRVLRSVVERNTAARAFHEAAGSRVPAAGDGSGNEEGRPDLRHGWSPDAAAGPPG